MTAKEYLKSLQRLDTIINQKLEELASLKRMSTAIGGGDYTKEPVQTSTSPDAQFVKTVNKIIDLDAEINADIDRFVDTKHRIINQIQSLEDVNHVRVLYERYVKYRSLRDIAHEMGFTYQYARRLHGQALLKLENKLQKATKSYKKQQ